ncbi:hypothetical protein EVAR_79937_1 [Eumeta japonica]|uniref:Uncharacterized protein n=1 Tax=Eumeta variegata TaxID=151549 RepID=A0A4C1Y407_EUMVA|nr:hypothetical protein EVAR_79937_1 [Eumeta japonica]
MVLLPTTSRQWSRERAEVPVSSDRRKFPPDTELIRAKNAEPRERISHPEYRSRARALQREVKARVRESEMRVGTTSWRKSNHPTKRFGSYQSAQNRGIYPPYPHPKPDNSEAIDDAEIAECLADSIETQCSHASARHRHISRIEEEVPKTSLEPKDDLAPVSLSEVQTLVKSLNTRKAPGPDGEVIGIHKLGKPRDLASYRPISP